MSYFSKPPLSTGGVTWPLTATDDLDMADNKVILGNSGDSFIYDDVGTFDSWVAAHDSTGNLSISVPAQFEIWANTDFDGSGNWEPAISLNAAGQVRMTNTSQGTPLNRYVEVNIDNGHDNSGTYGAFHRQLMVALQGSPIIHFGYMSDGSTFTGDAAIRSGFSSAGNGLVLGSYTSESAKFDNSSTAGDTRLLLWDVTAGSLVRVTRGAVDSGGTGYRLLRIPN